MNLTEYLKSTDEYDRAYKFARRAGVAISAVYDLLSMEKGGKRHRKILLETALKIKTASDGVISLEKLGRFLPNPTIEPISPISQENGRRN